MENMLLMFWYPCIMISIKANEFFFFLYDFHFPIDITTALRSLAGCKYFQLNYI